jgi:hypothetical protein
MTAHKLSMFNIVELRNLATDKKYSTVRVASKELLSLIDEIELLREQLFNAEQQIFSVEKERDEQSQEAITIWNKAIDAAASKAHGVGDDGLYYQIKDLKK